MNVQRTAECDCKSGNSVDVGFMFERCQTAIKTQTNIVIFNAYRTGSGACRAAVHTKQPYGKTLSDQDWIRHCVTRREWQHYLWLQIVRPSYIRQHSLCFQQDTYTEGGSSFLGAYRNKVKNKAIVKPRFLFKIELISLCRGINNGSDIIFYIKLASGLR